MDIQSLRQQFVAAREQRGPCPAWDELREDLLPTGQSRPGREERLAHLERCPYCESHVQSWKTRGYMPSDALAAIEREVAKGLIHGATGIARLVTRAGARSESEAPSPNQETIDEIDTTSPHVPTIEPTYRVPETASTTPAPVPSMVERDRTPVPLEVEAPPPKPERRWFSWRRGKSGKGESGSAQTAEVLPGFLVVETGPPPPGPVPDVLFHCGATLRAEVVAVDRVDVLQGDADLDAVCGVVIAGVRKCEEWPDAVRKARAIVPGRPIVVLAPVGRPIPEEVRRALGPILVPLPATLEEVLVALEGPLPL